jgi:hypothetical protein
MAASSFVLLVLLVLLVDGNPKKKTIPPIASHH